MQFFKRLVQLVLSVLSIEQPHHESVPLPDLSKSLAAPKPSSFANCKNSPTDRQCWHGSFDINTDYELEIPNGQVREYTLYISNVPGYSGADGYVSDRMLINETYPGPTISGDWGDTFRITVHNNFTNFNGTSIHWHGVRQLNTTFQDGVAGVTQCPIPPGESYTYVFRAHQYGTSWYHSHFSLQYADGILGPLVINGPTSMNYDVDLGPILLSDYFHADAFSLFQSEISGVPPQPDSYLLNGKGPYICNPSADPRCTGQTHMTSIDFEHGTTYRMAVVNTGVTTHMTFWIDGHTFSVVSTDFVPIEPYDTDTINVAIGQRYEIIITANASLTCAQSDFWIHTRDCNNVGARSELGIIRYNSSSTSLPFTPPPARLEYGCLDEPNPKQAGGPQLTPIVPRQVGSASNDYADAPLAVGLQAWPNITDTNAHFHKWILANSSLYLDWEKPSLSLLDVGGPTAPEDLFPASYAPIFLDYPYGTWVYFLILGNFSASVAPGTFKRGGIPVAHPIHVHGHDFVVLAQANETYDASKLTLNLNNPPRRDVAMLPVDGYLLIAFQVDNPGAWLMHCHIAFHASSGLALQFIERPGDIKTLLDEGGVGEQMFGQCARWSAYYSVVNVNANATQDDSGI